MNERSALEAEMRARLARAWPDALDASEDPHGQDPARLPAYVVDIEEQETEPRSMGVPGDHIVTDLVRVTAWTAGGRHIKDHLRGRAQALQRALITPDKLDGRVFDLAPAGLSTEVERGERRVGRIEMRIEARYIARAFAPPT